MIQICKSPFGQYYNKIVAHNGKVLMSSELFKTKQAAWKNAKSILRLKLLLSYTDIVDKTK